ncbi:MAG: hypothetical protein B6U88_01910 [Candidatus Aenigmarchaeota archaeon ex4484_56]|nr:MAG: hypothetical protein B6U88_01910 [Candidatus Aenigmarchaeota archaeon ex4484_56]
MPEKILVKTIMAKPVITIDLNKSVKKAAQVMSEKRVGAIVVVKKNKPVGILTDADIIKKVVALSKDPKKIKVKDIMTTPLVFVSPDDNLIKAEEKMKKFRVKRLPVIKNGIVIGIISNTDIARATPEMIDLLNFRLKMKKFTPQVSEATTTGICDSCGNYSENLTFVDDKWLCEECREE